MVAFLYMQGRHLKTCGHPSVAGMQNEEKAKSFIAQDIRFTANKGALYALFLGRAEVSTTICSLARDRMDGKISHNAARRRSARFPSGWRGPAFRHAARQ